MKTVEIISGTYGHKHFGKKGVHPVSVGEKCDVSDEEALRLEKLNVAKIIKDAEKHGNDGLKPPENGGNNKEEDNNASENENAVNGQNIEDSEEDEKTLRDKLKEFTVPELKEIARSKGIDCSKLSKKDEYVEALEAVISDEEQPPALNAENPVV